jgi:pilus assembly protein Flp/PilA
MPNLAHRRTTVARSGLRRIDTRDWRSVVSEPPSGRARGAFTERRYLNMTFFQHFIASLRSDEEGQGLAEYALILALIAIIAIVALIFLGGQVSTILSKVGASV